MDFGVRSDHKTVVCVRTSQKKVRVRQTNHCVLNWRAGPNWRYEAARGGFEPLADWGLLAASMRIAVAEN